MKPNLPTLLLLAGALTLNAQPSGPLPGPYHAPFYHPRNPQPSSKIWGGQWVIEQGGTWYWFYDSFGNDNVPLHALTSKDGVFWREEGPVFEADADLKGRRTIINPELYRLDDGRVVIAYTVSGVLRFASTRDMKTWERFGKEAELSVKKNPQWAQWYQQLLTPVSYRHPDGGWFHLVYATSPGIVGMGYARSQDGIHYDIKPPIRIDGVPNDRFDEHPTFGKGLELGGLTKLGNKYFMVGGGRQGDIIVSADKPEGPYRPTPLNHALPRGPDGLFMFPRFYNDVPDGPLVTHTLWSKIDGKRAYRTEPLKRVVREGDSIWFKWWKNNDKLKSRVVTPEERPGATKGALRSFLLPGIGDQCHVIETSISLGGIKPETNFATAAKVTANNEHRFPEPARDAEDYLAAQHAIDGHDERSWIAEFLGILHLQRMGEAKFLAEIKSRQTDSRLILDLGAEQPVGRVDARWTRSPGLGLTAFTSDLMRQTQLHLSVDGKDWGSAIPVSRMDKNGFAWDGIGRHARYVRITLPALGTIHSKLANLAGKEKPRSPAAPGKRSALPPFCLTGLAEVRVYEKPAWTVGLTTDLPGIEIECEGGENEVILVEPHGIVHYGSVSKSQPGRFHLRESRNIDRDFGDTANLRFVQQGDLFELYVNDYFIMVTQLRSAPTGKITLLNACGKPSLRAWETVPPGRGKS